MSAEKWSQQPPKAVAALNDQVLIIDNENAPTNLVSKTVLVSGLPLGEINDGVNTGTGVEVFSTKNGLNLQFRKLIEDSGRISITQNTNDISFVLTPNAVLTNQLNTYTAGFRQSFVASGTTAGLNINNSEPSVRANGDIWRNVNLIRYEDESSTSRTLVDLSLTQTLENKTLTTPAIANFTNATHTHATDAQGGLLTNSALTSTVYGSILGIGTQSQTLNMGTNTIINSDLPTDSIKFIDADTSKKLGFNISAINVSSTTTIVVPNLPTPNISLVSTADGKIAIANLADGDVGELITWTVAGVPTVIPNGVSGQILTVNVGNTPTFQTPNVGVISISADTNAAQTLVQTANEILINSPGTGSHTFSAGTNIVQLTGTQTLVDKTLTSPAIDNFLNATHTHETPVTGGTLLSTLALSDTGNIAYLNSPNTYIINNRQDFTPDTSTTAGLNVGIISGVPNTQTNGDIWYDSSVPSVFARINGADVNLGVIENFTWTTNHSAATFNLTNTGAVVFSLSPASTPTAANNFLLAGSSGIELNVPTTDFFDIKVAGTSEYSFSSTIFDMKGNSLEDVLQIQDSNSNELLEFTGVTSAVNHLEIENAIATQAPELKAVGNDSNIDIDLIPKGTGSVLINGSAIVMSVSTQTAVKTATQTINTADELITDLTLTLPTRIGGKAMITVFFLIEPVGNELTNTFRIKDDGNLLIERNITMANSSGNSNPITFVFLADLDGSVITVTADGNTNTFDVKGGGTNSVDASTISSFEVG